MDRESPDVIEQEMEQTRQSLTDKLAALEDQVVGTLQSATSTVQDTVQSVQQTFESVRSAVEDTMSTVKDTVEESVSSVSSSVRGALDFPSHVRSNPWGMVGGAAAAGFVTGLLVFRKDGSSGAPYPSPYLSAPGASAPRPAAAPDSTPAASPRPGWLDDLLEMAGREARKLGETAIQQLSASLHETVNREMPKMVQGLAGRLPDVVAGFAGLQADAPAAPTPPPPGRTGFQHYT